MKQKKKTFKFNYNEKKEYEFDISTYTRDKRSLYIGIIDSKTKEPYSDLTIYIAGYQLKENQAFIDPINEEIGLVNHLKEIGIITETSAKLQHNFGIYIIATFDLEKLKEYDPLGMKRFYHNYHKDIKGLNYEEYIMGDKDFETKSGYFLHFHPNDEGYDFSYYNQDKILIDGGVLESENFMKLKDILEGITHLISRPELDGSLKDLLAIDGLKIADEIIENIKI